MTPRVPALPYRKLAKALRKRGCRPVAQRGSHVQWSAPDGRRFTVPRHDGTDIDASLVRRIWEQAGFALDDLRR